MLNVSLAKLSSEIDPTLQFPHQYYTFAWAVSPRNFIIFSPEVSSRILILRMLDLPHEKKSVH